MFLKNLTCGKYNPKIIIKIKPFIDRYNWVGENWKKVEKNNLKLALNVLHAKK